MMTFHLQIVTVDGLRFEGEVEAVSVRAVTGNLTLLARHMDFVTALGMGSAFVTIDGQKRYAACIGGMLAMTKGQARLIATTFEWAEDIDVERAKAALSRAQARLERPESSAEEKKLATAAMQRATVRLNVAEAYR